MQNLNGEASAPGVVNLFGEYGTLIGEPALGLALDLRVSLKITLAEYDFSVVDGYKIDPQKHNYFDSGLQKFWSGPPIEFSTSSQLPMVSGLGTRTALIVALSSLLSEMNKDLDGNTNGDKKPLTKAQLAHQAFTLENSFHPLESPLGTSTSIAGGTILMMDIPAGPLWSIPTNKRSWYAHPFSGLEGVPIVLGFLKQDVRAKYSEQDPKPLFDAPNKNIPSKAHGTNNEPAFNKLQRFVSQKSFARDILKGLGKISRSGVQALSDGNLTVIGELLREQLNLIKILGIYSNEMRQLGDAALKSSYGVTLTGAHGDTVLAITEEPATVAKNIEAAGGQAVITTISTKGLVMNND